MSLYDDETLYFYITIDPYRHIIRRTRAEAASDPLVDHSDGRNIVAETVEEHRALTQALAVTAEDVYNQLGFSPIWEPTWGNYITRWQKMALQVKAKRELFWPVVHLLHRSRWEGGIFNWWQSLTERFVEGG